MKEAVGERAREGRYTPNVEAFLGFGKMKGKRT
jgi:hypothetical protein